MSEEKCYEVREGDCLERLRELPDACMDSVVTDPPAGISFMGRAWDSNKGGSEKWIAWLSEVMAECLRVTKPGGMALVWAIPRTSHWTGMAIERAGWEIRDRISHIFGTGFPKSLDVSKAIDRQQDDVTPQTLEVTSWIADRLKASGKTHADVLSAFGFNEGSGQVGHWTARTKGSQPAVPILDQVPLLLELLGVEEPPERILHLLIELNGAKGQPGENWWKREKVGERDVPKGHAFAGETYGGDSSSVTVDETTAATDDARTWQGYGTALKPAVEDWWLAMKPLDGTFAANALAHGVAGLNVDGCRIGGNIEEMRERSGVAVEGNRILGKGVRNPTDDVWEPNTSGRWPANLVLDEEAGKLLGEPSRFFFTYDQGLEECGDESTKGANTPVGKRTASNGGSSITDGSGSKSTEQSPEDTTSTTRTRTPSTIESKTSSASPSGTTGITTAASGKTTESATGGRSDAASDARSGSPSASSKSEQPAPIKATASPANGNTSACGEPRIERSTTPICANTDDADGHRFMY